MPRKFPRSVVSSYQAEDTEKKKPDEIGAKLSEDDFSTYDQSAYYLRATDRHGHAKTIQVTLPTTYGPAIQKIVDSVSNPYKSAADLARDKLIHGMVAELTLMSQIGEDVPNEWFDDADLERRKVENETVLRWVDNIEQVCQQILRLKDWQQMNEVLYAAESKELPIGLRAQRAELVRKYRREIPENFHWSYDVGE